MRSFSRRKSRPNRRRQPSRTPPKKHPSTRKARVGGCARWWGFEEEADLSPPAREPGGSSFSSAITMPTVADSFRRVLKKNNKEWGGGEQRDSFVNKRSSGSRHLGGAS